MSLQLLRKGLRLRPLTGASSARRRIGTMYVKPPEEDSGIIDTILGLSVITVAAFGPFMWFLVDLKKNNLIRLRDRVPSVDFKMASRLPIEDQSASIQPTAVATRDAQADISCASTNPDAKYLGQPDRLRVTQTPLRSQQEKASIEERLKVYCYLPKRREPLGCYLFRSIPSKVDCFRKKRAAEASQD